MAQIKYVGLREKGLVVHLPYPFTSMSRKQSGVTFAGPGDVQEVAAEYAGDLVTKGGGQFEFVETKKATPVVEPVQMEPVEPVEAVKEEPVEAERSHGFGFRKKKSK